MAATASVAVGSGFSSTITRRPHSKLVYSDAVPKVACFRSSQPLMPTLKVACFPIAGAQKRRVPKVSASVAQEETAEVVEEAENESAVEGVKAKEEEVVAEAVIVPNTKLYFGNLPYNCDSAQLAGIIQEYASPEMVEVLYERDTGRSRGFAFVTMSSVEDCEAVVQNLDGCQYGGRTLRVNFSDKPKPKLPLYPESDYKLFVGNLSWSVTSESLTQVFQEYGNVVGARVLYDGDSGRSRGYGFVCYSNQQEMNAAMESLEGAELEGRAMRINLALGKKS